MLEKRHCKATVVRSEICTPAFAAESVRQFMRQVSCQVSDLLHADLKTSYLCQTSTHCRRLTWLLTFSAT